MKRMSEQDPLSEDAPDAIQRYLRWHILAYCGAILLAVTVHYIWPADRGLYIPILLWGCALLAHFLYVRAVNTDDEWVEERSENISLNATDLSHIENIRERHEAKEAERTGAKDKT